MEICGARTYTKGRERLLFSYTFVIYICVQYDQNAYYTNNDAQKTAEAKAEGEIWGKREKIKTGNSILNASGALLLCFLPVMSFELIHIYV